MAPRKRKADEEQVKPSTTASLRVTRSSTRRVNGNSLTDKAALPEVPKKNKKMAKSTSKEKGKSGDSTETESEKEKAPAKVVDGSKTIVIEHCKQCNSFKKRAIQVKNDLENSVSGITVLVNPEKPRRGCFEVREEGGEKFITLLDMKRPFAPMKALDMDKVISDIIDKIK